MKNSISPHGAADKSQYTLNKVYQSLSKIFQSKRLPSSLYAIECFLDLQCCKKDHSGFTHNMKSATPHKTKLLSALIFEYTNTC